MRLLLPRTRRMQGVVAAVLAAVVAAALFAVFRPSSTLTATPVTPPSPGATSSAPPASTSQPSSPRASAAAMRCGRPVRTSSGSSPSRICIPAIRVDASIMRLGLNKDRTVQVPPLSRVGDAGWYRYSATAGAVGPTVILGHVDSAQYGEGVFFRLGQLHSGDRVTVDRADGRVATFRVDRVVEVSKKRFPTQSVYGATSGPALRLVTCGGRFDAATGNYLDNIIVYGSLLSLQA